MRPHILMKAQFFLGFLLALCASALFLGCPTEPEDEKPNYGGEKKTLPAVSLATADGVKYYSLSTGLEVTGADIETNKWDIAFSRTRLIYTNSGASAKGEGTGKGNGGVWHTEKTDLAAASDADKKEFKVKDVSYNVDVAKYLFTGMSSIAPTTQTLFNVMTYVGYEYGDGSTNDIGGYTIVNMTPNYSDYPDTGPLSGYQYNAHQYYISGGQGVLNSPEDGGPVYIIRHGDGVHYSKIQIVYEYASSKDNWQVTYQNF
jgi:hypothetical protein